MVKTETVQWLLNKPNIHPFEKKKVGTVGEKSCPYIFYDI